MTTTTDTSGTATITPIRGLTWLPFLVGFGLLWGSLALLGGFVTFGLWGMPIFLVVALLAVVVQRVLFGTPWSSWVSTLGLGRAHWRGILLALVISALVLLVFPLTTLVTGAQLQLVNDWPLILIGLFAFHGLCEELVWRGYAFRRLRVGRSFTRAVLWTMALLALTHIPIIIQGGPIVGIGAMIVAAATSIPFAYLYETGRNTIWAAAIVHTAIDSFKIFVVPPAATMTFAMLLIVISIGVPLLALAVRRRHLVPQLAEDA